MIITFLKVFLSQLILNRIVCFLNFYLFKNLLLYFFNYIKDKTTDQLNFFLEYSLENLILIWTKFE